MKFKDQFKSCYEITESLCVCQLKPTSGNIFCFNYMSKLNLYNTNTQQEISSECLLKADNIIWVKTLLFDTHKKTMLEIKCCAWIYKETK